MNFPDLMTEEDMALRLKEWLLEGRIIWANRRRATNYSGDTVSVDTFVDPRKLISIRAYGSVPLRAEDGVHYEWDGAVWKRAVLV